jgi:hypothetical protein
MVHRFVESVPRELEEGVLYVSMQHATVIHTCCCGCGQEVVIPLTPTDWQLNYDGESIALSPSVGNWQLPCRSHYVIWRNRVYEAGPWTPAEVQLEKERDRRAKSRFYAPARLANGPSAVSEPGATTALAEPLASDPAGSCSQRPPCYL